MRGFVFSIIIYSKFSSGTVAALLFLTTLLGRVEFSQALLEDPSNTHVVNKAFAVSDNAPVNNFAFLRQVCVPGTELN